MANILLLLLSIAVSKFSLYNHDIIHYRINKPNHTILLLDAALFLQDSRK